MLFLMYFRLRLCLRVVRPCICCRLAAFKPLCRLLHIQGCLCGKARRIVFIITTQHLAVAAILTRLWCGKCVTFSRR
ncbi:hypothetical protein EB796_019451 [Bugula neritina]|uniref:Uncharacterized protein n=1 Tax=Bugula neritina TaxID=10212 RepID=A0A7J7J871_BUGNE|nr:hypothetical protein EB796_019451 [Bugula neritina]